MYGGVDTIDALDNPLQGHKSLCKIASRADEKKSHCTCSVALTVSGGLIGRASACVAGVHGFKL